MEQRRLRLGDILDDYCPRERRVTNHAVVAMVEETVKQTRCTTCDAEHPYKGGQAPRRRKKEGTSALSRKCWQASRTLTYQRATTTGRLCRGRPARRRAWRAMTGRRDRRARRRQRKRDERDDVPPPTMVSRPAPAARREPAPEPPSAFQPAVLPLAASLAPIGVPGHRAPPLRHRRGPGPPSVDPRAICRASRVRKTNGARPTSPSVSLAGGATTPATSSAVAVVAAGTGRGPAAAASVATAAMRRQCRARRQRPPAPRRPAFRALGSGPGPGPGPGPRSRSGRRLQIATAATAGGGGRKRSR